MSMPDGIVCALKGGLIVSCQADDDDPLCRADVMAAMAMAAVRGGAVAIRARGADHIRAIKAAVSVPVIGLTKQYVAHSPVYITPTWGDVAACLDAGADVVAIDATDRPRPDGLPLAAIVRQARQESGALLMADIAHLHEGETAQELGFDLVSTTLAGYTEESLSMDGSERDSSEDGSELGGPDLALVAALADRLTIPIVAEGRITTPAHAAEALRRGAWAVCVGKAITAPQFVTELFVQALASRSPGADRSARSDS